MNFKKDKQFYVGQKAIIRKGNKILILRDSVLKTMDLPGGKIQENEYNFEKALKREVLEETGLKILVEEPSSIGYFQVPKNSNHRSAGKEIFMVYFKCKLLGGKFRLSEEHDWYVWVEKKDFNKYFKRKENIYKAIETYFFTEDVCL